MNTHVRAWLAAALVLCSVAAPACAIAHPDGRHGPLKTYMSKIVPQIRGYMAVSKRADDVFDIDPADDVSPFVEGLSDVAVRFDRLATRWNVIKAPSGLGLKHRGMGGAFQLEARAFAVWAEGWRQFGGTNDLAVLTAANEHASGLLRSAAYLQERWAAALSGALIRAYLPVPHWLEQMSMLVP